jgi:hypothetical protein
MNFYADLLPEIFGILITYELIDLILNGMKKKEFIPIGRYSFLVFFPNIE